jgi:FkbM family methyltransferase
MSQGSIAVKFKNILRSAVRSMGYDIVRHVEQPQRPFDVLSLVVSQRVASKGPLRFVQIGANDGMMDDPMRDLIINHGLTGLLVEPLPDLFGRLRVNYGSQAGLTFEQCAVGASEGEATIYRVRADADVPVWLHGVASFNPHHIDRFNLGKRARDLVEPVTVRITTLPALVKQHHIENFDLLQVDTEGMDCRIVSWALDAKLRPAIIHYEHCHASPEERAQCKARLAEAGYRFIDAGTNTLALREDV